MYNRYIPIFVFIISLFATTLNAQEYIVGLGENANTTNVKTPLSKSDAIIELPFIDDFSKEQNVPDNKLWINSNSVFVNKTFAKNPPTVGVATFDPFDANGKIYSHASSKVFAADTLESMPINLNYMYDRSIYLSFFYQPQGFGDIPEYGDSLSLEFYSVAENKWHPVWSANVNILDSTVIENNWMAGTTEAVSGDLGSKFNRVHLNIYDTRFQKEGFKFRFINYASIAVNSFFPGRSTATDHWHLDFVYLDKDRTEDLELPDIAISEIQATLGGKYTTIPAHHLNNLEAQMDLFGHMDMSVTYKNLGWGTKSVFRNFGIRPIIGTGNTINSAGGSENIFDNETVTFKFDDLMNYEFYAQGDSSAFEIESYLITDNVDDPLRNALRYNDTVRHVQWFKNCYAYDDGTAENGYGLFGAGTSNGKVAVEFYNYTADSIRGVYMYFNRAVRDANVKYFSLAIWEDNGSGAPGKLLHSDSQAVPVFKDSLNKYVAYKFSKPVFIPKSTKYYVGWIQHTDDFLNIGFDRNNNNNSRSFYNISNLWENSMYEGSLMIRPIYAESNSKFPSDNVDLGDKEEEDTSKDSSLQVYPNPIRGGLAYVLDKADRPANISKIEIYDLSGALVTTHSNIQGSINLEKLNSGVYLMRIWQNNKVKEVKRIVVSK